MAILHKVHRQAGKEVLAVCDKQLVGKRLKHGKMDFNVSERFYNGEEISEGELRKLLHDFDNINIVGDKAVGIAVEEKIVGEKEVVKIAGVSHVQVFKV